MRHAFRPLNHIVPKLKVLYVAYFWKNLNRWNDELNDAQKCKVTKEKGSSYYKTEKF